MALCLFRRALAATLFLAIGGAGLAQERPPSTSRQEEISVKAGETLKFKLHLDKAPTSSDGRIMFTTSPLFNTHSGMTGSPQFCAFTEPQKLDYYCKVVTSKGEVVGTLRAEITSVEIDYSDKLVIPNWKPVRFLIQGPPPLPVVREGIIEVTVVPSQAQLLRSERAKLQHRISDLTKAVSEVEQSKAGASPLAAVLRTSVGDEIIALEGTQRDFDKFGTAKQKPASMVFFDDLHRSYRSALVKIDEFSHRAGVTGPAFRLVSEGPQDARPKYPLLAQATFSAFEQNELAYQTVVDTQSLTFDLEVRSSPEGATVSYWRRGDTFQQHAEPTDAVIRALPYAIWIVEFHKTGFRDEIREHDPFREANHVVDVSLQR